MLLEAVHLVLLRLLFSFVLLIFIFNLSQVSFEQIDFLLHGLVLLNLRLNLLVRLGIDPIGWLSFFYRNLGVIDLFELIKLFLLSMKFVLEGFILLVLNERRGGALCLLGGLGLLRVR